MNWKNDLSVAVDRLFDRQETEGLIHVTSNSWHVMPVPIGLPYIAVRLGDLAPQLAGAIGDERPTAVPWAEARGFAWSVASPCKCCLSVVVGPWSGLLRRSMGEPVSMFAVGGFGPPPRDRRETTHETPCSKQLELWKAVGSLPLSRGYPDLWRLAGNPPIDIPPDRPWVIATIFPEQPGEWQAWLAPLQQCTAWSWGLILEIWRGNVSK